MKKNLIGLAGCLLLLAACDESRYDIENLVPDEYHTILYMKDSGKLELTLYDTNDESVTYSHSIQIIKSGSDPKASASAELKLMTQEDVDAIYSLHDGKNYKVISSDCYKLVNPVLNFESGNKNLETKIEVIPTKIKAIQDAETQSDVTWVFPLEVVSEKDSINSEKNQLFCVINPVIPATVGFVDANPAIHELTYGEANAFTQNVSIGLNTDNKWNINCSLGIDEDYIQTYNQENGTNFVLLDPSCYTLPESVEIPETSSTTEVEVQIDPSNLEPGEYMIPIKINATSKFEHSETVYPLAIRIIDKELDRAGWTAFASSTEWNDEWWNDPAQIGIARKAKDVLDGDLATFWHSRWTQRENNDYLPFYLVIDTQKEHVITRIEMMQRYYNSSYDTKSGIFFVTSDEVEEGDLNAASESNWTQVGTFDMLQNPEYQPFDITPLRGRYIIIKMIESYRDVCSLSEVKVYGTNVSEQ